MHGIISKFLPHECFFVVGFFVGFGALASGSGSVDCQHTAAKTVNEATPRKKQVFIATKQQSIYRK